MVPEAKPAEKTVEKPTETLDSKLLPKKIVCQCTPHGVENYIFLDKSEETPTTTSKKKVRIIRKVVTKVEGGTSSAVPEGVVLIVGKPKKTTRRPRIAQEPVPIAKPDTVPTKTTTKAKTTKKATSKKAAAPVKEKPAKTASKVKPATKPAAKESAKKSAVKQTVVKTAAKQTAAKPAAKKPASKKSASNEAALREAQNADRILNANLNNPNYGKDRALKDITEQLKRIRGLSSADQAKLLLSSKDLEGWKNKYSEK